MTILFWSIMMSKFYNFLNFNYLKMKIKIGCRLQAAVNETRSMLKKLMNRALWAIEKVQETFFCKKVKGKT